jgi:hypothetical protein
MELHGVTGSPYKHPEVRRKMPAPFTRSRVDLDGGRRAKREWQDVNISDIKAGDTVAGFGTVDAVSEFVNVETEYYEEPGCGCCHGGEDIHLERERPVWRIRLFNVMGEYRDFPGEQRVFAFAREPKGE